MERNQERYWEDFKMDYIHLESYLASLKEGNYQGGEDAAFCAFQAGILYERLLMRMASEHIRKRQKNLRVLKEGHESSYGTPEEKRLRWEAFRSAFENVSKDNPDWTRQACYESVAEQFDVSAKTIQRAVLAKKETS